MLLDVLRPLVAHRAQRLAGEAAADHGAVFGGAQQRFLVAAHGARFGSRDEARAEPHAVGAERDRGGEPATVEDSAGRDDRYPRRRPRRRSAGRAASWRRCRCGRRLRCPARSRSRSRPRPRRSAWRTFPHMLATSTLPSCRILMTSRGTPSPATNSDAPPVTTLCASSSMRSGQRGEQVDAERLVGGGPHRCHLRRRAGPTPSSRRRACRSRRRRRRPRRLRGRRRRPSRRASRGARYPTSR